MRLRHVVRASWLAVALMWLPGLIAAALVAHPVATSIAAAGIDQLPAGDSSVFASGGYILLETFVRRSALLQTLAHGALAEATVLSIALLVPLGAACACLLGGPQSTFGAAIVRGLSWTPRFALLGGLALVAQGLWCVVVASVWARLWDPLRELLGARTGDIVATLGLALACAPAWGLGLVRDVARSCYATRPQPVLDNVTRALEVARAELPTLVRRSSGVVAGSAAIVGLAAGVTTLVDVGEPGAWRVLAVLVVHQTAALSIAALRAFWLATCLRCASAHGEPVWKTGPDRSG